MRSIRTQFTFLTVCAIVASILAASVISAFAVRNIGRRSSEQMLTLLCETGEKNLDYYFESVEKSVSIVSAFVENDLTEVSELTVGQLSQHIDRVREIFANTALKTSGVLTYYYRIDPEISPIAKGFWYVDLDGNGFREFEATDITLYDTSDTSSLVWFTTPKYAGTPVWLPPYITDNLDVKVISYNVPVYRMGTFIGVVGIEIDYSTMAEQVDAIKLYDNGYAFINDTEGNLIYHPYIDVASLSPEELPKTPDGIMSDGSAARYSFDGVMKEVVRLPLTNGMMLNVSVPVSEINASWHRLIVIIFAVAVLLLAVFITISMKFTQHITQPLQELTEVAQQVSKGNYECDLDYKGNNEVGILTGAFKQLTSNLKVYVSELNDLAYADALTSVHNKGAYDVHMRMLDEKMRSAEDQPAFAVCFFDCNNLKSINDNYGHDKGDSYLRAASALICSVFSHSPVFRIGGDEFAVIMQDDDYRRRDSLLSGFDKACGEARANAKEAWEKIDIARGMATFEPDSDTCAEDVAHRADMLMYENKKVGKSMSDGLIKWGL